MIMEEVAEQMLDAHAPVAPRRSSSRGEGRVDLFSQLVQRANRPQPSGGQGGAPSA
jgi:hypothetical protein